MYCKKHREYDMGILENRTLAIGFIYGHLPSLSFPLSPLCLYVSDWSQITWFMYVRILSLPTLFPSLRRISLRLLHCFIFVHQHSLLSLFLLLILVLYFCMIFLYLYIYILTHILCILFFYIFYNMVFPSCMHCTALPFMHF